MRISFVVAVIAIVALRSCEHCDERGDEEIAQPASFDRLAHVTGCWGAEKERECASCSSGGAEACCDRTDLPCTRAPSCDASTCEYSRQEQCLCMPGTCGSATSVCTCTTLPDGGMSSALQACPARFPRCDAAARTCVCEPGSGFCEGKTARLCESDGTYSGSTCLARTQCSAGRCVCATEGVSCDAKRRYSCSGGKSVELPCGEKEECVGAGRCACVAGSQRCTNGVHQLCGPNGAWVNAPCGAGISCDAPSGTCRCTSTAPECQGTELRQCSGDRWMTRESCSGSRPVCTANGCVECTSGQRPCTSAEGCGGQQSCNGTTWSACSARARCPAGWLWDAGRCVWTSELSGQSVAYFPHRADNEKMAVTTGSVGCPPTNGTCGPVYVEAALAQWSNPPAPGNGNYCGKGDFVSTWVGCVKSDGSRGYGRDLHDFEWESKVVVQLRCEANETVGIFKHSWGHDAFWHCTRQLTVKVAINHDSISSCIW